MLLRAVRILAPVVALGVAASTASAQRRSAECRGLRTQSNFRLNSTKLYLDQAVAARQTDPARFTARMRSASAQLDTALRNGGADELTLWFLAGEVYLLQGDLVAADTMFTKAEGLAEEDCRRELGRLRRNEWGPLLNGALSQQRAGNLDSAVALLRRGNIIFRGEPTGLLRLAGIYAGRNQADSAIKYALLAGRSTEEPRFLDLRKAAFITAARLQQAARRWTESEAVYREFLRLAPRDLPAMAGLGAVLGEQSKTAEASALYDSLSAAADTVTDSDVLFETATEIVRARRFPLAAHLYERSLTTNRCNRDALYNLASTYNATRDSVHLLQTAQRLVAVDSMNRGSLALLAQAYVLAGDRDRTVATLLRHDSLPWTFELVRFEPGDSTASLLAAVANPQQRVLAPFRLTIEFVNGACEPVSQSVVEVPEIAADGSHSIDITGRGRGIRAYRYRAN